MNVGFVRQSSALEIAIKAMMSRMWETMNGNEGRATDPVRRAVAWSRLVRQSILVREMLYEILEHGLIPDVQVSKPHSASPGTQLTERALGDFGIMDDLAIQFLDVDESAIAAENLHPRACGSGSTGGKVTDAKTTHAYIDDVAQTDEFARTEERGKGPIFPLVPLVFSLLYEHGLIPVWR